MYEKTFKDFTFIVNNSADCFLRFTGSQGKGIPYYFTMSELEEFQKTVDWALGRMYLLEKREYDGKLEEAAAKQEQLGFDV